MLDREGKEVPGNRGYKYEVSSLEYYIEQSTI
jgi:hypothetical protein